MAPSWLSVAVPLLSAVVGAVVGGMVVHRTSSARDSRNEQRARRVEHLISAYRRLIAVSERQKLTADQQGDLEAAVADVMLLGDSAELEAAGRFVVSFADQGGASLDPLLRALRGSLRRELDLDDTPPPELYILRLSRRDV